MHGQDLVLTWALVILISGALGWFYWTQLRTAPKYERPPAAPGPEDSDDPPATLVRTYRGKSQVDTVAMMQKDADRLSEKGYVVASQSWAPGQWGCAEFIVALVLCVVLIGILVFVYMLLVKPDGTLTVTYARRDAAALAVPENAIAQLTQLADLRDRGAITDAEYEAKKAELLARL